MTEAALDPRVSGALTRYRVMAVITGTFLLTLLTLTAIKYIQQADGGSANSTLLTVQGAVGIIHGWIYVIYLVTTIHLWLLMHWGLGRLVIMGLGGIVPFLSFILEHRFALEVKAARAGTLEA